jgi:hypothetical protein
MSGGIICGSSCDDYVIPMRALGAFGLITSLLSAAALAMRLSKSPV